MKFQGSQQAQLATVGDRPIAFLCSSSRARQVCSNDLQPHSSSRGSMVGLQGSQQGLSHLIHLSLLVQLARAALEQKGLKTHISMYLRRRYDRVPESLCQRSIFSDVPFHYGSHGPQVCKVSLTTLASWFNHISPEPPVRAAKGDGGSKTAKTMFCRSL